MANFDNLTNNQPRSLGCGIWDNTNQLFITTIEIDVTDLTRITFLHHIDVRGQDPTNSFILSDFRIQESDTSGGTFTDVAPNRYIGSQDGMNFNSADQDNTNISIKSVGVFNTKKFLRIKYTGTNVENVVSPEVLVCFVYEQTPTITI